MRKRPLCLFLTLLLALAPLARTGDAQGAPRLQTWLDARSEGVVRQSHWFTCGPAAVATLLQHYFGLDVAEGDALAVALEISEELGLAVQDGISALALLRSLERLGVPAAGYRVTAEALADYFRRRGLPVIAHVTDPQPHYVVVVGLVGEVALVADPSWGRRVVRWLDFAAAKGFSGVVLVPVAADRAGTAREAQTRALAEVSRRLGQMVSLSGWVTRP